MMYLRESNLIVFKTAERLYRLEQSGKKANAFRFMDRNDLADLELSYNPPKKIRIKSTKFDKEYSFERELTNITIAGDVLGYVLVIFSWQHKETDVGEIWEVEKDDSSTTLYHEER